MQPQVLIKLYHHHGPYIEHLFTFCNTLNTLLESNPKFSQGVGQTKDTLAPSYKRYNYELISVSAQVNMTSKVLQKNK